MDNACIHHHEQVEELVQNAGKCYLVRLYVHADMVLGVCIEYLPPYSPNLNPIEEVFSKIKAFLCRNADVITTGDGITFDMYTAMSVIMLNDAAGYFIHGGYFWSRCIQSCHHPFVFSKACTSITILNDALCPWNPLLNCILHCCNLTVLKPHFFQLWNPNITNCVWAGVAIFIELVVDRIAEWIFRAELL